jgi:hypothetical protein
LIRLPPSRFRGARDKAEVPLLREIVQMFQANARQTRNFKVGENLLAGSNGNHRPVLLSSYIALYHPLMPDIIVRAAFI